MVSTFTTNKSLEKPGNGDYVDTWNVPVNADLDVIDQALGTVTSVNLAGGNVTLADTQYRSMGLTFTGALPAARTVTIPSGIGGSWIVTNNTTDASGGPWSVTVLSGGGGTSVALVRSKSSMIYSDGTNITEVNINAPVGTGSVTSVAVSGGTTGLTTSGGPITTSGTITISGTLIPANGGTGITSYTTGDIPYASASGTLSSLASVATGNVLLSGGIAGAPSYGKVGLTTHVTGTLPVANGGTGITAFGTGVATALGQNVTGSGSIVLATSPAISGGTINNAVIGGTTPAAGTFTTASDSKGNIRNVPPNSQTGAYVLVAADAGKFISITTGGVTVNTGIFSAGETISIYNNSGSSQTITQGAGVTIRLVGTASTGNRTLPQYGLCTLLCVASNTFVITGSGLT